MKDSHPISLLIVIASCLIVSGCSSTDDAERYADLVQRNTALQEENTKLSSEVTSKNALTARLQIKLLEKDAEINKLSAMRQDLNREVVRKKAKIPTPKNKAEAVTLLAEAETDINAAKELAQNNEQQFFNKSDQLMAESKVELDQGNFDKAYALAAEALELTQAMQLKRAVKVQKVPVLNFLPPLTMQVAKRSKIRKSADMHAPIAHILDPGTIVTATSYQGHWIKIAIKEQQLGWIYYSLLTVPEI